MYLITKKKLLAIPVLTYSITFCFSLFSELYLKIFILILIAKFTDTLKLVRISNLPEEKKQYENTSVGWGDENMSEQNLTVEKSTNVMLGFQTHTHK